MKAWGTGGTKLPPEGRTLRFGDRPRNCGFRQKASGISTTWTLRPPTTSTATFLDLGRRGLSHPHTSEMTERKLDVPPYQLFPLIPKLLPFSDLERDIGGRRRTVSGPIKAKVTAVQAFGRPLHAYCGSIT